MRAVESNGEKRGVSCFFLQLLDGPGGDLVIRHLSSSLRIHPQSHGRIPGKELSFFSGDGPKPPNLTGPVRQIPLVLIAVEDLAGSRDVIPSS